MRKVTISFFMSACPSAWNSSAPTGMIFMKFYIWALFENMSKKFKFPSIMMRITGSLHEDQYTLITTLAQFFLEWDVSDKNCKENQNKYIMFNSFFFENRAVYEIMWINFIESNRPQMAMWYMHIAWWTLKAKNTHLEYAFPPQPRLPVNASMLRYTHITCLVFVWVNRDIVINENYRVCCGERNHSSIYDGKKIQWNVT